MKNLSAIGAYLASFLLIASLLSCTSPQQKSEVQDRIDSVRENTPGLVVPRSDLLDPYLVDVSSYIGSEASLSLYADPDTAPGMARVCTTDATADGCPAPDDQSRRLVTEVDGYRIYLFSGPDDVGFDSAMANRVMAARWTVDKP